jgi:hypothetical protein
MACQWPSAVWSAAYLGGALTDRVNRTVLRSVVMIIGLGLSAYFFWTLYGRSVLYIIGE